ncbi:MAG TPA: hypothetical protein IAD16_04730, partial [Candidatus Fimisoma avicola]|nr:hypothetical protein [Candidatus Fimisoma avicola]
NILPLTEFEYIMFTSKAGTAFERPDILADPTVIWMAGEVNINEKDGDLLV